jgi:vancomycin permeability regulator SanA
MLDEMRKRLRRILILLLVAMIVLIGPAVLVRATTAGESSDRARDVPHRQVALVLGAGLKRDGTPTMMLQDRIQAAAELWKLGRVDGLLMSGDNGSVGHDEVGAMRDAALALGVPAGAITLDHAGFDTYDSCFRAHEIFAVRGAVVVTQAFHMPRALYLCRSMGIDAVGLAADRYGSYPRSQLVALDAREVLASVKAVWQADVTKPDPRYLGQREQLHLSPRR